MTELAPLEAALAADVRGLIDAARQRVAAPRPPGAVGIGRRRRPMPGTAPCVAR